MDSADPSRPPRHRPLDFEERRLILGLSPERAEFLAACSHQGYGRDEQTRHIPYDHLPLLREAARLGISLNDTAKMMEMTQAAVAAFGVRFPHKTTKPNPPGATRQNLFTYDPAEYT